MGQHDSPKVNGRRPALLLSLGLAVLLIVIFVQGIVVAGTETAVNQAGEPDAPTTPTITETEKALQAYVAGHTLTRAEADALVEAGVATRIGAPAAADLSGSEKQVDQAIARAGDRLNYTIVISNSGDIVIEDVMVTDTLPISVTFGGTLTDETDDAITWSLTETEGTISWLGNVGPGGSATLYFDAIVSDTLMTETVITNTAIITAAALAEPITIQAATQIITDPVQPPTTTLYLPLIALALDTPTLQVTRPNSNNEWTLLWNEGGTGVTYEIQEARDPAFTEGLDTFTVNGGSYVVDYAPSPNNVYFYRVRAIAQTGQVSAWSNGVKVIGGYYDEFVSDETGWEIRRTTFIEEVRSFYEIVPEDDKDWLIMQVEDAWDWGITSPLQPAPEPPYVIESRIKHANTEANLKSFGIVFGGDWNGDLCPDPSTVEGWYEHEACFNQFYNTNIIYFGPLKLLYERVDELVWCPNCSGSPLKRLGDIDSGNVRDIVGTNGADDYHTYRIEVREDEIRFLVDGDLEYTYGDTRYIDRPYFGIFASTDEYSNATARVEYFSIMPLNP